MTTPPEPHWGEAPSRDDLAWDALGDELAPAKSLERVEAAATRVVGQIALVGTVLGAAGLVATVTVLHDWAAKSFAVAAVVASAIAVVIALLCQVLTSATLNTANRLETKAWYRRRVVLRGVALRWAGILVVAAVLCATVSVLIAVSVNREAPPHVTVTRTVSAPDEAGKQHSVLDIAVSSADITPGTQASTTVLDRAGTVLVSAVEHVGADGAVSQELSASAEGTDASFTVEVAVGTWSCTTTATAEQSTIACEPG